jgi:hypothetical protein
MPTVVANMAMSLDAGIDGLRDAPIMLDDPDVIGGTRVTHLSYQVRVK